MAAQPRPAAPAHRARLLRALGVVPWVRRLPADAEPELVPAGADQPQAAAGGHEAACVVVLPAGCAARELDLLGRALQALGPVLARAARIEAAAGRLAAAPAARAYLVFGEAQAHALGRELPAAAMRQAHIVLADEPAAVLSSAAGKRRLWHALRSLRRALAGAG
jgi:hypothetical protein